MPRRIANSSFLHFLVVSFVCLLSRLIYEESFIDELNRGLLALLLSGTDVVNIRYNSSHGRVFQFSIDVSTERVCHTSTA